MAPLLYPDSTTWIKCVLKHGEEMDVCNVHNILVHMPNTENQRNTCQPAIYTVQRDPHLVVLHGLRNDPRYRVTEACTLVLDCLHTRSNALHYFIQSAMLGNGETSIMCSSAVTVTFIGTLAVVGCTVTCEWYRW